VIGRPDAGDKMLLLSTTSRFRASACASADNGRCAAKYPVPVESALAVHGHRGWMRDLPCSFEWPVEGSGLDADGAGGWVAVGEGTD
jgi:hypothetical protein